MAKLPWHQRALIPAIPGIIFSAITGEDQTECNFIRHVYKPAGIKYYNEVIKGRKYPIIKTIYGCQCRKRIKIKYVNAPYAFPSNVE